MKKQKVHPRCTILRTKKVTYSTFNMATGEMKDGKTEIVTEPCGTPLFSSDDEVNGICTSCQDGRESEGNTFANEEERARATKKK